MGLDTDGFQVVALLGWDKHDMISCSTYAMVNRVYSYKLGNRKSKAKARPNSPVNQKVDHS